MRRYVLLVVLIAAVALPSGACAPHETAPDSARKSAAGDVPMVDSTLRAGEGYIEVAGGRVWYRIEGSGPGTPLLLVHGGPAASSDYFQALTALGDERPVVFYDQLGCGRSDWPDDTSLWRTERFVEELGQVREALALDPVHILAHSWGTMLTVDYMLTQPEGVESLILASPALSIPRWLEDTAALVAALPPETQEILARNEAAGTTDSEEYVAATMEFYRRHVIRLDDLPHGPGMDLGELLSGVNMDVHNIMWGPSEYHVTGILKDYDRTDRLGEISVPTLFTAGRYDEATPGATAWYQSLVPGARLEIIEDASHMTMIEQPERYAQVIRDFLRSVEETASEESEEPR
jgi:proline iminopeptidase